MPPLFYGDENFLTIRYQKQTKEQTMKVTLKKPYPIDVEVGDTFELPDHLVQSYVRQGIIEKPAIEEVEPVEEAEELEDNEYHLLAPLPEEEDANGV